MLKKRSIRKIVISLSLVFTMFLVYMIPNNRMGTINVKKEVTYVDYEVITNTVFLLNDHGQLGRTKVVVNDNNQAIETKIKELINILIKGGEGESRIPSGFKAIIPTETKLLSLKYEEGLVKINFSKELMDVSKELEMKVIESLVYTLTTIPEIQNIIIYLEGDVLTKLPQTGFNLPSTLNRDFGINKTYDFTSLEDITKVTVYYIDKYNDNYYYVPVTKYVNDDREKIKIIVSDLASSNMYNTNLMSFLNSNTKLLAVELEENIMKLTFNEYILSDMDTNMILEEVIYTINLSIMDNYDVESVIYHVNNQEIYKSVLKTIE